MDLTEPYWRACLVELQRKNDKNDGRAFSNALNKRKAIERRALKKLDAQSASKALLVIPADGK